MTEFKQAQARADRGGKLSGKATGSNLHRGQWQTGPVNVGHPGSPESPFADAAAGRFGSTEAGPTPPASGTPRVRTRPGTLGPPPRLAQSLPAILQRRFGSPLRHRAGGSPSARRETTQASRIGNTPVVRPASAISVGVLRGSTCAKVSSSQHRRVNSGSSLTLPFPTIEPPALSLGVTATESPGQPACSPPPGLRVSCPGRHRMRA